MKFRMPRSWPALTAVALAWGPAGSGAANVSTGPLVIPTVPQAAQRRITVDDMAALRRIETLSVSPDRRRFVMLVRQADVASNRYRMRWFAGGVQGEPLVALGDGGETRLALGVGNRYIGALERPQVRWSADGRWIAYTLTRDGETQLWRSRIDGGSPEQVTHNAADVTQFEWSRDGRELYFTAGTSRVELRAQEEAHERRGYNYDTDINTFADFMLPNLEPSPQTNLAVWVVSVRDRREHLANESERGEFKLAQARASGGRGGQRHSAAQLVSVFAERADGAQVWASRPAANTRLFHISAFLPQSSPDPIQCPAEECSGYFEKIWWSEDGTVLFLRREGLGSLAQGLYAWSPTAATVTPVVRVLDDLLTNCDLAAEARLVCVRETPTLPSHVAAIDLRTAGMRTLVDVNPEFRNITLGRVERFEWDTPKFQWSEPGAPLHGVYPDRAFGYILYPPDFDPAQRYPVFIAPYSAAGFDNSSNQEYALHALAAHGFVVLNTNFPRAALDSQARLGPNFGKHVYSAELGFPHLSMYMESTVRALDVAISRGFIDEHRVGIGGVSHGTFVPLYMVQKHDRLAAVSISSGGSWGQHEYYLATAKGKQAAVAGYSGLMVKPVGAGLDYWKQIDLAENVETIEAPILMNVPATETYGLLRLINHMAEAGKPYDAYVFPRETHLKWQPAHLSVIMHRNVDWFRFWLQSYEDPEPAKADQYVRWRKLREQARATQIKPQPPVAAPLAQH